MQLSVCIQDPTYSGTTYLYEAILTAAKEAKYWRGLYAFASRDGVNHLIEDQIVLDFMSDGGEIDLIVGIDAVTNRAVLERMQELEQQHVNFRPRVFWNQSKGLFHPKISDFLLEDGRRILIVGSGNLTPGGLAGHFEAYAVIVGDQRDEIDIGGLETFLTRHVDNIRGIDDEALERAAANIIRGVAGGRRVRARSRVRRGTPGSGLSAAARATGFDRILVAQVPRAGGRWAQVHFNAQVIQDYFRLNRLETERVYLTRIDANAERKDLEVRPCVYSAGSNRNYKIEIGAAKNCAYPDDGRPLLIFRELRLRCYDYMILLPGEHGYGAVLDLTNRLPSPGGGLPRPITDMASLAGAWPECPLLHVSDAQSEDL